MLQYHTVHSFCDGECLNNPQFGNAPFCRIYSKSSAPARKSPADFLAGAAKYNPVARKIIFDAGYTGSFSDCRKFRTLPGEDFEFAALLFERVRT